MDEEFAKNGKCEIIRNDTLFVHLLYIYMYVVIYCSSIFSVFIFIFYFSSEILAKFSYSVNPKLNKVYVCMHLLFSSRYLDLSLRTVLPLCTL